MILLVDKIEKSFGSRTLFTGATLQVNAGERYALVGPTVQANDPPQDHHGLDNPDAGSVTFAKDINVGYLEQETKLAGATSIIREVMDAAIEIKTMGERAEELQLKIARPESLARSLRPCLTSMVMCRTASSVWVATSSRAMRVKFSLDWVSSDRFRAALLGVLRRLADAHRAGKIVLAPPRCPAARRAHQPLGPRKRPVVAWFHIGLRGAVLIVSHDRAFMDACVDHVAALENRRITTYTGNYSSYLKQREDNLEQMRAKRAAQDARDRPHAGVRR